MSMAISGLPNTGSGAALATGGGGAVMWTQGSLFLQLFGLLLIVLTIAAIVMTSYNHRRLRKLGRIA